MAVIAPPFFPLDEARAGGAFRGGRGGVRAAPVLRLRVRGAQRVRGAARGDRAAARDRAEPARAQGLGQAVGGGRAVPARRARRVHRRRGARRARPGRAARQARCRGSRRCIRRWSPRSCASRPPSARPRPSGCAARSSASRSMPPRRRSWGGGACRSAATSGAPLRPLTDGRARGARAAVILVAGAGAMGASVAYHLALARRPRRRALRPRRDRRRLDLAGDGRRAAAVLDRAEVELARESIAFFEELGEPFFHQVGYLFLATTEAGLAALRRAGRASGASSASRSSGSTPSFVRGLARGRRARRCLRARRTASPIRRR